MDLHGDYILAGLTVGEQRTNKYTGEFRGRNLVKQNKGEGYGWHFILSAYAVPLRGDIWALFEEVLQSRRRGLQEIVR